MVLTRRVLMRRLAALGVGLPALAAARQALAAPMAPELERRLELCRPPQDPLLELLARNQRFSALWQDARGADGPRQRARRLAELWQQGCQLNPAALAEGQRPWAAVLGCADSRVAPEWLFACGMGELFEVRTAGNTASDAGVASLEYAVAELAVPLILVLGHSGCGAVQAARSQAPLTPLLADLVAPIRAALPAGAPLAAAVRANALAVARALPRRSSLLAEAVAAGRLRIEAAVVEIATGRVSLA
jgi:carbonic anhydrase